jgi:UDP-N-acetylmuramoyl-tripeptide--D-alanyl-D-alanine ligase
MLQLSECARVLGVTGALPELTLSGISTDSRRIGAGELFVALKGENFDGHDYAQAAVRAGAAAVLVARALPDLTIPQLVVADPLIALGQLARAWRQRSSARAVAITGSNGKTTVKEMLAAILRAHADQASVLATEGNLNNAIGLPMMLLRLTAQHRYAVLEMGMNHRGEIDYLTRIARPDVALVNNAQRAHIGELGSQQAIAEAKGEIFAGLHEQGIAVINADDRYADYWYGLNARRPVLTFGLSERAAVRATQNGTLTLQTPAGLLQVNLKVPGDHNARNAAAATAAALALGIPPPAIVAGLNGFEGVKGRLQLRPGARGSTLIDDTYNANPDSTKAAIRVLAAHPGRRFLVLGDMGELGAFAREAHAEVGTCARNSQIDQLFALGKYAQETAAAFGDDGMHFNDLEPLVAALLRELDDDVTVLVKGSRFMRMERVIERLAAQGGTRAA